jgi:arylsulfatase A-like enzyme
MLELAGQRLRPEQHVDGVSLLPLLKGEGTLLREAIFWHFPHYHGSTWAPGAAVRAGDWKLIEFYHEGTVELYNLAEDIGERSNLAGQMPDRTNELRKRLRDWQESVGAKMPVPNPDYRPGA